MMISGSLGGVMAMMVDEEWQEAWVQITALEAMLPFFVTQRQYLNRGSFYTFVLR